MIVWERTLTRDGFWVCGLAHGISMFEMGDGDEEIGGVA